MTKVERTLQLILSIDGRVRRGQYWAVEAAILTTIGAVGALAASSQLTWVYVVAAFLGLVAITMHASITIKRLHDLDLAGGWWLLSAIPFVGQLFVVCIGIGQGSIGPNKYGESPMEPIFGKEFAANAGSQIRKAVLTGVRGEYAGASIVLDRGNQSVELGSSSHLANLVFRKNAVAVAPRHATLLFDEDKGFLVCDQNSQFGVFVNGVRLASGFSVRLNNGDTLEIGDSSNMFRVAIA